MQGTNEVAKEGIPPCTTPMPPVTVFGSPELLERVMGYQNTEVVRRLVKQGFNEDEAKEVFEDTKRFLYLCGTAPEAGLFAPPERVDEGWHTFILFTEDYAEFCQQFFGRFIHHRPTREGERVDGAAIAARTQGALRGAFGVLPSSNWDYGTIAVICSDEEGNSHPNCRG